MLNQITHVEEDDAVYSNAGKLLVAFLADAVEHFPQP